MRRIEPVTIPSLSKPTTSSGAASNGAAAASDETKKRLTEREAEAADTARRRQKRFQAYKKDLQAVKSVAVIVLVFMMCWLPLSLSNSVAAIAPSINQPYKVIQTCIIFSHMNSAINPFLYAYGKEFRMGYKRAFAKMFPCMCALKPQDSAIGTKAIVNAVSGVTNGMNYSTNDS